MSVLKFDNPGLPIFVYQAPKVLNQAGPIQNDWYTIGLADGVMLNSRIYDIVVNIEDTNETLEVQALIDGETIEANNLALTHSTNYFAYRSPDAITRVDELALSISKLGFLAFTLDGQSVEIQVRKSTAAGVGNLTGIVTWGQKSA